MVVERTGKGSECYITATDADKGDTDEDIVSVKKFWDLFVFEFGVLRAVEDYGWVLHIRCGSMAWQVWNDSVNKVEFKMAGQAYGLAAMRLNIPQSGT